MANNPSLNNLEKLLKPYLTSWKFKDTHTTNIFSNASNKLRCYSFLCFDQEVFINRRTIYILRTLDFFEKHSKNDASNSNISYSGALISLF